MEKTRAKNRVNYYNTYTHGSTVRKIEPKRNDLNERLKVVEQKKNHKNNKQEQYMSIGQTVVITFLLIAFFGMCVSRLQLQAATTASVKKTGQINTEYNKLKNENDAEYVRLSTKYNLLEIKDKAINKLGMVYAKPEQVMFVNAQKVNRVTQYNEIPE